jgi:hypothetical protein
MRDWKAVGSRDTLTIPSSCTTFCNDVFGLDTRAHCVSRPAAIAITDAERAGIREGSGFVAYVLVFKQCHQRRFFQ